MKYEPFCLHIVDNLDRPPPGIGLSFDVAEGIAALVRHNMAISNQHAEYSDPEMEHLASNKTASLIRERLVGGYLTYLSERSGRIVACGMVIRREDRYEGKTLHVDPACRGLGLGRMLAHLHEEKLRSMGVGVMYIESLRFADTIAFHQARGYVPIEDGQKRIYSILMRKML